MQRPIVPSAKDIEKLWARTNKDGECWLWDGPVNNKGYGIMRVGGRDVLVHRLSWVLEHGTIPEGMVIRHSCDLRRCVNHAHLSTGTPRDNTADMIARGRKNPFTKYPANLIREIRRRAATGERHCDLAAEMGVSRSMISLVCSRKARVDIN